MDLFFMYGYVFFLYFELWENEEFFEMGDIIYII